MKRMQHRCYGFEFIEGGVGESLPFCGKVLVRRLVKFDHLVTR